MAWEFAGWMFTAGGSARQAVAVSVGADGLAKVRTLTLEPLRAFRWPEASVSARVGNIPRRVTLDDATQIETADNETIDLIQAALRPRGLLLGRIESSLTSIAGLVVIAGLMIWGIVAFGIPGIAGVAAGWVPESVTAELSESTVSLLDQTALRPSTLPRGWRERVHGEFDRLRRASGTHQRYKLIFRDGGRLGANAFALPDGQIIVTDQLVRLLTERDQLAAVLAHEMAHVDERHGMKRLLSSIGFGLLVLWFTGDIAEIGELAVGLSTALSDAGYSRDFEREADAAAVDLLRKAAMRPDALADALLAIEKNCGPACAGEGGWLASHPGTAERVSLIRDRAGRE